MTTRGLGLMAFDCRRVFAAALVGGVMTASTALFVLADDGFSISGTYVQNAACKGDGTDPPTKVVKITDTEIHSNFGLCTFVKKERDGRTLLAQMSCNGPGGNVLLGDVRFTVRDDKTIDFTDQDHTYKAVLYRCPQADTARQMPQSSTVK
jgi:hypothetical protein